ncbi:MAG TPA: endonuclease [Cyanothece sp. UBA12306]|nr:endonuclease [Cyanothece sp. UBA12306]
MSTILSPGDIAIIGFNFDNPDQLAFLTLVDIAAGTAIKFTDNGWKNDNTFRSNEGIFTWTATTDITAGTVIKLDVNGVAFSASGDQIIAYQGTDTNPTFIYALNSEGSNGEWQSDATSSNTSALPTGLVNGETAVALDEIDNAIYTGTTSGTKAELLAAISDKSNWTGSDSTRQNIPTDSFTITDNDNGGTTVFINEIHYDNSGSDVGEFIELAGSAGTNLDGWSIVLYNGNNGSVYNTIDLTGNTFTDQNNGFGFVSVFISGIQNGSPDGIALVDNETNVVQFLSYEGSLTAIGGPADGLTSTDIGVSESSSTPIGFSLQLTGTGSQAEDFTWTSPAIETPDAVNNGQSFGTTPPPPPPNQIIKIHTIQGTGLQSSLTGQIVTVEAIVIGDFQGSSGLRGFYLQEEDTDADANALTSEGIFVFDGSNPGVDVNVGDKVQVTGTVTEFNSSGTFLTELSNITDVTVVNTGNNLPIEVTINDLKAANGSSVGLENYEGMRVNFAETLTVTEYFELGRFGNVALSTGGRLYQPTNVTTPGTAANNLQADNDLRRIVLDDGSTQQNADPILFGRNGQTLSSTNILRGGDTVTQLSGILDQRFGDYRVQTNTGVDFQAVNQRPTTTPDVGGTLKIANYNVLNYFTTIDNGSNGARGADSSSEFQRQQAKLVSALTEIDADILGLVEIENNSDTAVSNLVSALNTETGLETYNYIATGTIGTDAIKVALIYKPDVVNPFGNFAILDSSVDPTFQDNRNRPALAQTFEEIATGEKVTISLNHFKSKGSSGLSNTQDPNFAQGDGQGFWNATRTDAANALVNWLATDPTGSGDNDFLIMGDLNAYAMEDPITTIKNAGYTNLIEQFNGLDAYSYVFDGQFGYLDHALSNSSLTSQVTGVTELHINADEPNVFDYNEEFNPPSLYSVDPYRTSDHDPVLIGLNLGNFVEGTADIDILTGTNNKDVIAGFQGFDIITTGDGTDQIVYNSVTDGIDFITDFEVGNDTFVLTELLDSLGYNGSDPIADGYIDFVSSGTNTMVQFDADGTAGSGIFRNLIFVENVTPNALNDSNNFVF